MVGSVITGPCEVPSELLLFYDDITAAKAHAAAVEVLDSRIFFCVFFGLFPFLVDAHIRPGASVYGRGSSGTQLSA